MESRLRQRVPTNDIPRAAMKMLPSIGNTGSIVTSKAMSGNMRGKISRTIRKMYPSIAATAPINGSRKIFLPGYAGSFSRSFSIPLSFIMKSNSVATNQYVC